MSWNNADNGDSAGAEPRDCRSGRQLRTNPLPKGVIRGLLAGLIVASGAAVALWWFTREGCGSPEKENEGKTPRQITEAKPEAISTNIASTVNRPVTNKNIRLWRGIEVISSTARTNSSGSVVERIVLADGRKIENITPVKSMFSNPSDQIIALAISAKPGQAMPPLPPLAGIENDFAQSLLDPIRIDDNDTQEVKDLKLSVKEARAYIAAEIKSGRTVAECLIAHREMMEDIADRHTMALQEINKMKKDGATNEEISEFRSRINEVFREKGLPELSIGTNTTKDNDVSSDTIGKDETK